MLITSFGNNPADGRPQLLIGLTPNDIARLIAEGGTIYLNRDESEDPEDGRLPVHLILMMDENDEAIARNIEKGLERDDADDGEE